MGAKTFINNTEYGVTVMLTVRRGDTPGNVAAVDSFSLGRGEHLLVTYSEDNNPYLDGISVNALGNGNIILAQDFVATRGSDVDNALNTNNTVSFGMQNQSIILSYSNT